MPRPAKVVRPRKIHISLPEDLALRLELYLFSPALNRVPYAAFQKFFEQRTLEFFAKAEYEAWKEAQPRSEV